MSRAAIITNRPCQQQKFGPILLSPGINPGNASSYFTAAMIGICMVLFINMVQPYILTEHLAIAVHEQGRLSGLLGGFGELTVLILVLPFGWIADRAGRRPVFISGFLLMALGIALYPLAQSSSELFAFRFIYAVGAAGYAVGLLAISADYPDNKSRGKWAGLLAIVQGLMASLVAGPVLAKLPQWFAEAGADALSAGRYAFWLIAALGILSAVLLRLGLKAGAGHVEEQSNFRDVIATGVKAAREKPTIALSYAGAFATRGDFAIITTFLMLWITQAGVASGMSTGEALGRAGMLFGISQLAATLWAPIMGPLLDRINRVTGVAIAMGIASVAYLHIGLVTDPLGTHMLVAVIFLGIAEMSTIMSGQVLLTQEAPEQSRGRIVGLFSAFGSAGMLVSLTLGGVLFDQWMQAGPFVFMGCINLLVLMWAIRVRLLTPSTA